MMMPRTKFFTPGLTQRERGRIRQEALKDSSLYFLVILGSTLDDMVRDNELSSEARKKIYESCKEYCLYRGYLGNE